MQYKLIGLLGGLFLIVLAWAYTTEYQYFDNTLGIAHLLLIAAGIGGFIGILSGLFFTRKDKGDTLGKVQTVLFCFFVGVLTFPVIAAKTNRYLADATPTVREFTFIKQTPVYSKPFGQIKMEKLVPTYFLIYLADNTDNSIRIKSKVEWLHEADKGKTIQFPIKRGFWGYDIVLVPENVIKDAAN